MSHGAAVVIRLLEDEDERLITLAQISDWSILILLILAEAFVLIRLQFKMDFSGKLTLFLHFIVAMLRVLQDYYAFKGVLSNVLGTFCQVLIWFSLYYFTFEMCLIRQALMAESPLQYKLNKSALNKLKYSTLAVLTAYGLCMSTIIGLQYGY